MLVNKSEIYPARWIMTAVLDHIAVGDVLCRGSAMRLVALPIDITVEEVHDACIAQVYVGKRLIEL